MRVQCPHCRNAIELLQEQPWAEVCCPSCGSSFALLGGFSTCSHKGETRTIGRFQLLDTLGTGAFGTVWKARDPDLDRVVAVKIPRREGLSSQEAETFFARREPPHSCGIRTSSVFTK